jgi:transposase
VLASAEGRESKDIAAELGGTRRTVGTWRNRFVADRLMGIQQDAPRGGRAATKRAAFEAEIIRKTTRETPQNATQWSTRSLAKALGSCMPRHRHQEWIKFLKKIDAETPADLDLHLILDNYATLKHPKVKSWLKRHPRFRIHFTPTSSSWLNVIERWFRDITQNRIRNGVFHNVPQLIKAIRDYIDHHNTNPTTFVWTKKAADILEKVARARASLNKIPSA